LLVTIRFTLIFYKSLTNTFIYIVVIGLHLELFQQAHCIRKYFLHAATVSSDVHEDQPGGG
jgi:hypothetical protein